MGLATGSICAGLIGSCGINFVATGDPPVVAFALANATNELAISEQTNKLLSSFSIAALRGFNRTPETLICPETLNVEAYLEYMHSGAQELDERRWSPSMKQQLALVDAARTEVLAGREVKLQWPVRVWPHQRRVCGCTRMSTMGVEYRYIIHSVSAPSWSAAFMSSERTEIFAWVSVSKPNFSSLPQMPSSMLSSGCMNNSVYRTDAVQRDTTKSIAAVIF